MVFVSGATIRKNLRCLPLPERAVGDLLVNFVQSARHAKGCVDATRLDGFSLLFRLLVESATQV